MLELFRFQKKSLLRTAFCYIRTRGANPSFCELKPFSQDLESVIIGIIVWCVNSYKATLFWVFVLPYGCNQCFASLSWQCFTALLFPDEHIVLSPIIIGECGYFLFLLCMDLSYQLVWCHNCSELSNNPVCKFVRPQPQHFSAVCYSSFYNYEGLFKMLCLFKTHTFHGSDLCIKTGSR